jgi:NADH dehydrogenase FAD-containing subunit
MKPEFFGKVVPLTGQRKQQQGTTIARLIKPHLERLSDGRYLQTQFMQNRCCNDIEVGSRQAYVMDDYGYLVRVDDKGSVWR